MVDDVKKRSVTANDSGDVRGAPVFHWMLSYQPTAGTGDLPAWWSPARDWYLRQTIERESFWAGALSIAVTKMSSLAWELDSDAPRVRNYFQELLLAADNNQSWVNFLARHLMDFLCTDNGAFVEVVRATSAAGSRILGLVHLDSLRCTRTGDPDYPVIYRDTKGVNHEMQPHQVIVFSDMPDPSETYYGVGHCAASRAYRGILKMAAIETYIYEKVSGKRALAVDLVGGISDKQLATAVTSAEEERIGKGYVSYMGAIVVPTLSDVAITHTRINFAELPDGFDREKEFNIGLLQYANAIGLDPQELQPLTGAALGTGTQAEVLSEKGKGKGLAAWRQQWTHAVNQFVLPDSVTFAFDENDLKDTKQKVDISKTRADALGVYIDKGIVTPSQAAQILADEGEIPDEFVPADQTPGGTLTDSEKPESEADQAEAQAEQAQAAAATTPAPTTEQAVKERLVEFDAAMKEFREAMKEGGFNESLHPRDDEGKFTESGGGGSSGGGHSGGHGGGGGGGGGDSGGGITRVEGGYKTPKVETYGEAKEAIRGVIDKVNKEDKPYAFYGLRFEDKNRKIGESVNTSRHNPDREDERAFPEYGSRGYRKLPELGGSSAWRIDTNGYDEKWVDALMGSHDTDGKKITQGGHAYIIGGDEDHTHSDADPNEIVIGRAKVVAKIF